MQMVRQDDRSIDGERPPPPDSADNLAQRIDVRGQHLRAPVAERYGEEIGGTRDTGTPVTDHATRYRGDGLCRITLRRIRSS